MATLSASKIYQMANPNKEMPFGKWIEDEKALFLSRKEDFKKPYDFETWLNIRWSKKLKYEKQKNADGLSDILSKINETANTVKTVIGVPDSQANQELANQNAEAALSAKSNTILGLNPMAAYAIGAVALLAIGLVIYKIVKKSKKSE